MVIKQLMYSNISGELHTVPNQVIATINQFQMRQDRGKLTQSVWDQFTTMRQVCKSEGGGGFFAILFLYLADCQKYRNIVKDMENPTLQKNDPLCK